MAHDQFSDAPFDTAPSAPLRRRRRFAGLADLANTPMPQGQMVGNQFVPANPLQMLVAAASQGVGLREARSQYEDTQALQGQQMSLKERALQQQTDLRERALQQQADLAREKMSSTEDIAQQRADIAKSLQEWRDATAATREEMRQRDQELRQRDQDLREQVLNLREKYGGRSLGLREQAEARQRAKLSGGERRRLGQPKPAAPAIDDLME